MSTTTPPMGGARPVAPPTTRPLARRVRAWTLGALLVLQFLPGATAPKAQQGAPASPPVPNAAAQATGRVAGRVVDAASGQPLAGVQVMVGTSLALATSDLDGRYRTTPVAAGIHRVLARRLGQQPKQYDSITVRAGETVIVNFALSTAAVNLTAVVVSAERANKATSEASLLSMQRAAASATDGISAEQIKRSPDADAGQAAARVSGVSVVDNRFVVVRGLSERYSNTLLNGVEVASPEPAKKVVPLDIFPSALIDAIVVTKSATPDKPGDFSGGSVEIRTKEFPEQFVFNYSLSSGFNSQTTGKQVQLPQWRGLDFLGFDAGTRRARPALPADFNDATALERFSEGLRSTWNPPLTRAAPNLGFSVTLGNQMQGERNALGYIASLTYSDKVENQPARYFKFLLDPSGNASRGYVYNERRASVDWGAVFNLAGRLGTNHKFGLKNLYTRNADEQYTTNEGFNIDLNGDVRGYGFSYLSRDLWQVQLTGEHLGKLWRPWRLEWKGTQSLSHRDEPDNRQVTYIRSGSEPVFELGNNSDLWFRYLNDRLTGGQADLSVPFPWFGSRELQVKAGGAMRKKVREFDASLATFNLNNQSGLPNDIYTLPPHRLFTPDLIGDHLVLGFPGSVAQPYSADDQVVAYYGMLDVPIFSWLRVVGGMRVETWSLDLYDGGRARFAGDSTLAPTSRRHTDPLWSANATITLGSNMNVRLAGFRSVARPDTREMSRDEYTDLVGACPTVGNPALQRTTITNADARFEWYPGPGEIFSVSGFFKYFEQPILRTVSGEGNCRFSFGNGVDATNVGAEVDIRKGLAFLPGPLTNLSVGLNAAYVRSKLTVDASQGVFRDELPLEDQSPYLLNANLGWVDDRMGLDVSVLYNWFDDRINRYGFRGGGGPNAPQGPNIVERARGTFDAKAQWRVRRRYTVTVSGRNLGDASWTFFQETTKGRETTGYYRPGRTITVGVSYAR